MNSVGPALYYVKLCSYERVRGDHHSGTRIRSFQSPTILHICNLANASLILLTYRCIIDYISFMLLLLVVWVYRIIRKAACLLLFFPLSNHA